MNKVQILDFQGDLMVWIKTNDGRMIDSIEYLSQKQVDEICRDYDAYIETDERNLDQIEQILVERDNMDISEARDLIHETRELILSSDFMDADDIMADMLGLEPDYIMDLLGY